jgi:2',3'-cyclic-nucleotide 2'-phosphodiesterase
VGVLRYKTSLSNRTILRVPNFADDATGLALKVAAVRIGGRLEPALPGFGCDNSASVLVQDSR